MRSARYSWIHGEWIEAPTEWRSAFNLAGIGWGYSEDEREDWAAAMEQTWAIWQGIGMKPRGYNKAGK